MSTSFTPRENYISQLRNTIIRTRALYKQAAIKEERAFYLRELDRLLKHYQDLTKPDISRDIKVGV